MLSEYLDESVTERDIDFLKEEFPRRGDVDRNLRFYKMAEPEEGAQIPILAIESDSLPNESVPLSESVPLDIGS